MCEIAYSIFEVVIENKQHVFQGRERERARAKLEKDVDAAIIYRVPASFFFRNLGPASSFYAAECMIMPSTIKVVKVKKREDDYPIATSH